MKKITLFSFLIVIAFAACRKENVIITPAPAPILVTPALKKLVKSNSSYSTGFSTIKNTTYFDYNSNGAIRKNTYSFYDVGVDSTVTAVFYTYKPNLLEMSDENGKIMALCHLNSDGFVTIDSTSDYNYIDTYDVNKYKVKGEVYNRKTKKLESNVVLKYENERLISTFSTYFGINTSKNTTSETIYTYDKEILNTISGAYAGVNFQGKQSKYLHTKEVTTTSDKPSQKSQTDYIYETNAEGYVTKQIEKFAGDNTENVTTYIYK